MLGGASGTLPRPAMAAKAEKDWSFPRFWVARRSYKKQPVKKNWGKILDLAWLKFAAAALQFPTSTLETQPHAIN